MSEIKEEDRSFVYTNRNEGIKHRVMIQEKG